MTNEQLNYESAVLRHTSKARSAAWISLLVLGILAPCGSVFMGVGIGMIASSFLGKPGLLLLVILVYCILPILVGVVEIVSAMKVRRHSFRAAIVAIVVVGLQVALLAFIAIMGIIEITKGDDNVPQIFAVMGVLALMGAAPILFGSKVAVWVLKAEWVL